VIIAQKTVKMNLAVMKVIMTMKIKKKEMKIKKKEMKIMKKILMERKRKVVVYVNGMD